MRSSQALKKSHTNVTALPKTQMLLPYGFRSFQLVPAGFFVKNLSENRSKKNSAFDRELFVAYLAMFHFKP